MSRISGKNTKPEILVRSMLHKMGYRFRIHRKDLPGKPDITLPKHKKVIFINGCFWHGHKGCPRAKRPSSNIEFWNNKINRTIERDQDNFRKLTDAGWKVLVLWTCEIKDSDKLKQQLISFLQNDQHLWTYNDNEF